MTKRGYVDDRQSKIAERTRIKAAVGTPTSTISPPAAIRDEMQDVKALPACEGNLKLDPPLIAKSKTCLGEIPRVMCPIWASMAVSRSRSKIPKRSRADVIVDSRVGAETICRKRMSR